MVPRSLMVYKIVVKHAYFVVSCNFFGPLKYIPRERIPELIVVSCMRSEGHNYIYCHDLDLMQAEKQGFGTSFGLLSMKQC